jgi:predicted amidohydrolase YtcJ
VRGFAYHESVAGPLDRWKLDAWLPDRPVRIQHRTGALWIVSSRGLAELGPLAADEPGVERDAHGTPTGRLFRADALLRERLQSEQPDLAAVGARLAALGVTGVCDASAHNAASEAALFARAAASGALPQRLLLMGSEALPAGPHGGRAEHGALKILLDDIQLPELDGLAARVRTGHVAGRSVAFHCVTRAQLFLALAALEEAGARPGDRVEHASVAPPEALPRLAALGATVVTQPGFVHERGDLYLREVSEADRPWLYRLRGFDAAGVKLAAGTDAPYGSPDPWLAMRCAVERRTRGGAPLGEEEAVAPERALALFTTPLEAPGGSPRDVAVGAPADLCLLHVPWREARKQLSSALVAATWIAGALAWRSSADRG